MSNPNQFYQENYGDTRIVAFEILQEYFDPQNQLKISDIFNKIIGKFIKESSSNEEEYLNNIDDELLNQILVGTIDNIDEIDNLINQNSEKIHNDFKLILRLVIYELKYAVENSSQNIFEEYQKICERKSIKFNKNLVIKFINEIRNFEL